MFKTVWQIPNSTTNNQQDHKMISSLYSRRHCCAAVQTNLPSRHLLLSGTHRIQGVSKANQTHSVSKANQTHSVSKANQTHSVSKANQTHSVSKANQTHSVSKANKTHSVSKANQTHSVSKANKTHSQDIQLPFYEPALDNVFLLNVLAPEFYV